jgi:hypothetical protein
VGKYVIRTPKGNKGPFTRSQIQGFFEQGKLPLTLRVLDMSTRQPVSVADLIDDQGDDFRMDVDLGERGRSDPPENTRRAPAHRSTRRSGSTPAARVRGPGTRTSARRHAA